MKEIDITALEEGQRLDRLLGKYLRAASGGFIHKMLRKKNITLNGRRADGSEKLVQGDVVRLFFAQQTLEKFSGPNACTGDAADPECGKAEGFLGAGEKQLYPYTPLDILYEDANVLLINKPAGMLTQKAKPQDISLNEYAIGYLLHTRALRTENLETFRPSVCNRLDRNTSGIVAVGKTVAGLQKLSELFSSRQIHKYYRCLVIGKVDSEQTIDGYLVKNDAENTVRIMDRPDMAGEERAQRIVTRYRPVMFGTDGNSAHDLTLLEVELITGKSHQIRAHLSYTGHPAAGDPKYGAKRRNEYFFRQYGLKRQLLHACRIEFPQMEGALSNLSGKTFEAPLPKDMMRIIESEHLKPFSFGTQQRNPYTEKTDRKTDGNLEFERPSGKHPGGSYQPDK